MCHLVRRFGNRAAKKTFASVKKRSEYLYLLRYRLLDLTLKGRMTRDTILEDTPGVMSVPWARAYAYC